MASSVLPGAGLKTLGNTCFLNSAPPYSTMCALCFKDKGLVIQFRSHIDSNNHMLAAHQPKK